LAVVTVVLNAAATLPRTLESLQRQGTRLRHVVVDGGSADGSLEIARAAQGPDDILISEPDGGISDAMNKGLAAANSRYVAVLHSDDWLSDGQLALALAAITADPAPFVFGDVEFHRDGGSLYRERGQAGYVTGLGAKMSCVPHPSMLVARGAFEAVGLYRTDLKLAMDYEWLLRAARAGLAGRHVEGVLAHMTHDGASNTLYRRTLAEVAAIAIAYGRPWPLARAEQLSRTVKTSVARRVETLDPRLHLRLKRLVNPKILPDPSG
jgi:glycosyltransferase involved in cell wall biosynthesis